MSQAVLKKVQIVYYLSRNGHLEHPHYMELTHLVHHHHHHHHPTLKDVMERLAVLRGKAMPSLYSWSCKRSYKNGYVWNDLDENDEIFPSEGGEYVLKGSEIVLRCTNKLQRLQLKQDSTLYPKRKLLPAKRPPKPQQKIPNNQYGEEEEEDGGGGGGGDRYQERQTFKSCSRGVSTDEIEEFKHQNSQNIPQTAQTIGANLSPPSARSDNSSNTLDATIANNQYPRRFEDGDTVGIDPMLSRNSMLLSLIACGGSSSFRKSLPPAGVEEEETPARKSCSGSALHKGGVRKAAAEEEEEDEMMIKYMSENPRLIRNLPAEEKEYFSGSIVEGMVGAERLCGGDQRSGLKRSSSFNQERSDKARGEAPTATTTAQLKKGKGKMKGKCIPRKKASSKKLNLKIQALH